ncbi:MAG TPA: LysE family translocator [Spirochaetota bacterium]|nr:LysE family translocator [Spirochaetota bacterium]
MIDQNALIMFVAASTALAFAPGPDNIFVLAQSITMGRTAGFIITLGLCTGLVVHTTTVALGVAAIFQTSIAAFTALKYIGAAYLLYLAWKAFTARVSGIRPDGEPRLSRASLYRRGIIMNVTNPKVSLFFMAFLPPFADPANGSITVQLILLGFVFILVTLLVFGFISQIAGAIGRRLARSGRWEGALNKIAGTVFALLAVKLVLTGQK